MKQLTVAELLELLKQMPPNAIVSLEGCDCIGECVGAQLTSKKGKAEVLLTRL